MYPQTTVKVKHIGTLKGRFLLFQVYRNFADLVFKLLVSTFYKEISKFQQKVQIKRIRSAVLRGIP